jgi:hypothetical protein
LARARHVVADRGYFNSISQAKGVLGADHLEHLLLDRFQALDLAREPAERADGRGEEVARGAPVCTEN